jgi:hypothetical protein
MIKQNQIAHINPQFMIQTVLSIIKGIITLSSYNTHKKSFSFEITIHLFHGSLEIHPYKKKRGKRTLVDVLIRYTHTRNLFL